ncbi:hypothetical protein [Clostridium beijerinckii]|uniref:DUF4297 domain-containing protein n=1 Tax=Clostridium beijerinckii TaxID=1520 RepID=A0AAW3W257_CLOBE|nr:hypothetical protein [Clostridium beijerinckii]MBC2455647.1 hypothetical protein [Clostridium beijerinckii]MBC2473124.1 hypothetical protein [Clostridium beijerinckii]NOV62372.1 hypothetical protein [Clostridium beijerinckii]NOV68131.1 hypothetical protein [Clostridium beijerinckii]NOW30424.1 hypothetical protein [Clostridium beijerinckii]
MCDRDGGYYAIKGFLYQFDKTIIDILDNPDKQIFVEHIQDINYDDYVIQIKHKETAKFVYSKVKEPIIQLLRIFKSDNNKKLILYCYFSDRNPEEYKISSVQELNNMLKYREEDKNKKINLEFSEELKGKFIKSFTINFSEDYEGQFLLVIKKIKTGFGLQDDNEALLYHSLIRGKLLSLALKENPKERGISKSDLDKFMKTTKDNIFYLSYKYYLGRDKYIKFVKSKYFTFKSPNINCFERLFILDCYDYENLTTLHKIINNISKKYFKTGKSPAPYICLKGIKKDILNEVKIQLLDDNVIFNDGTCFDGDRFRVEKIAENASDVNKVVIKLIKEEELGKLIEKVTIKEYYHLFLSSPMSFSTDYKQSKVQVENCEDILEIIC